jgi:hypothetical protein
MAATVEGAEIILRKVPQGVGDTGTIVLKVLICWRIWRLIDGER